METVSSMNNMEPSNTALSTLLGEFTHWCEANKFFISLLTDGTFCDDGRIQLELSMDEDKIFTLYCPSEYPSKCDEHFFVECSPPQLWCNSVNEFLLDSVIVLSLEAVLNKIVEAYGKKPSHSPYSSSTESDGEEFCDDYMEVDEEWEHKVLLMKKRWRNKEALMRASAKKPKTSDMFEGTIKDHPKQIFSNSAASGILTNDLVTIIETKHTTGINAEPVDDNIYKWSVFLSKFNNHPGLEQDLEKLNERFGYDYIELQLDFMMDLYPFYPPIIKVVRPRLQGTMMVRVASMNMLKLSHWNPARDMKNVLLEIKEFLGLWARLDLNSERNNRHCYRQGAYNSIENHLLCLAWVSEVESRANRLFPKQEEEAINMLVEMDCKESKKVDRMFPAGTGYSCQSHVGWDVNAHLAAQREKDKQIEQVLQKILAELRVFNAGQIAPAQPGSELHPTYSSFQIPSCSTVETTTSEEESRNSIHPAEDLYNIIEESALVPFLESKLQVDSFLEISRHRSVYRCIVDLLMELAAEVKLVPLLWTLPDQVQSLYTLITKLDLEASNILVRVGKAAAAANGKLSRVTTAKKQGKSERNPSPSSIPPPADCHSVEDEEKLALDFHRMSKSVTLALQNKGMSIGSQTNTVSSPNTSPSNGNLQNLGDKYVEALKQVQFLSCDIEVTGASAHYFSGMFNKAYSPTSAQVMRIAQEMAALSNSLPLDLGSSIFVRTDDAKCTLLRALIIGPEGTPYSSGCFVFDIIFPFNYPVVPPQVQLRTTGMGTVRFNPNLYHNGKVCLSLLGTWRGLQGESWNQASTLLQVLISIQSLILVAEPYFNEPGFETQLGTPQGAAASASYNVEIMTQTIRHAMIAHMQRPEPDFQDVIRLHFAIKKDIIMQEITEFITKNAANVTPQLLAAQEQLGTQLGRLPLLN